MTEKHNRLRELEEQKKELNEKLIAISKEHGQILRSLATGIEQDPQKDLMDMTLDELYKAFLESIRNADLKLSLKETEHRNEQISKKIDTAKNMLKALDLCENCNMRSRANQWAKYCHAPCTPEKERPKEPSPPRLAAPPTLRQMIHMFMAKPNPDG